MVDRRRERAVNEAAAKFAETLAESYRIVYEQAANAQQRQTRLAQDFSERVMDHLREQAESGQAASAQLTDQARRQQEAGRVFAQESAKAYVDFLDTAFSQYWEGTQRATGSAQEGARAVSVVDTSYTADSNPDLINPERGMYFGVYPTGTQSHTIVPKWLYLDTVCNQNLTWNGYNQTGTSAVLNAYAATLEKARTKGVKVLFRPRYDTPSGSGLNSCGRFHADTKTRQLDHITAVAAMLGDYRDVIAYIQAGYLGRWGEWNDGGFGSSTVPLLTNTTDRNAIIDHVLEAYAAEGILQHVEVRRPVFAREVLSRNANARVAFHNDCFMSTDSDMGTYSNFETGNPSNFASAADAKAWAQSFTANASFGGETCPASGGGERWRSCSNMIGSSSEPASLHMNYLNGEWATDAVSTWTSGGCYPKIKRRLGYRFEVTRVEYTPTVPAGQTFQVRVDVKNTGWAKLHKPRQAKLVLRNGSTTHVYNVSSGAVASWPPGQTTTISVNAPAPSAGTYSVRLWIPDPDAQSRIPYAVKLATLRNSANVFDPNTGENNLGVSITVQ